MALRVDDDVQMFGKINTGTFYQKFQENSPLIGLYGYQDNGSIKQVGFYTLNAKCADI